jgi:hypothetical protein
LIQQPSQRTTTPIRILIPTTQLSYLDYLYPQLEVLEIEGAGSFSDSRFIRTFNYGEFKGILTGRAEVAWAASGTTACSPLRDILTDMRNVTTVADAVLEKVVFYERMIVHDRGVVRDLTLKFEKGNIHPQVMRSLVVGTPNYPLQQVYQILVNLRQSLRSLPKDLRKHWKPGYLILTAVNPAWVMNDLYLMENIRQQRFTNSLLVTELSQNWDLKDYQSLLGLTGVHAT